MEVEIQSKNDNVLLKRMEVQFLVRHENEGTPKRELIRNELAEKLAAKKENVVIDHMRSAFGTRTTLGYAKIYNSPADAKAAEADPILKRNGMGTKKKPKKKEEKKGESKPVDERK
jgi:small subunit ribosomal protein S24e